MSTIDKIGSSFLLRILHRMQELGVSQAELAKRMDVSRPYITKMLHKDVNITFRTAEKLANALRMDFFPELRPQGSPSLRDGQTESDTDSHQHHFSETPVFAGGGVRAVGTNESNTYLRTQRKYTVLRSANQFSRTQPITCRK